MSIVRLLWEVAAVVTFGDLVLLAERFHQRHRRKQWITEQLEIQMSRNRNQPGQHRAPRKRNPGDAAPLDRN